MKVAEVAQQTALIKEINEVTEGFAKVANKDFETLSLTQILINRNSKLNRKSDIGGYITQFNRAGGIDNFVGAYLNSEWYKRNLYMYALMQKYIGEKDTKVMVLLGASHIAMFKEFIDLDNKLKSKELVEILKTK
jgi:ribosomal protein S17E